MKKLLAVLLALVALLALPRASRATTLLPMYLDDLTAASQTVVYGKVTASRAEWDAEHRWIYTIYTIEPYEYLKGRLGETFELREPGGELGGLGMIVDASPVFKVGEEAVLFVWTDARGMHQATSLEQGVVKVETDSVSGAKTAARSIRLGSAPRAAALSARTAALSSPVPLSSRTLPELFDQIRASVARATRTEQ